MLATLAGITMQQRMLERTSLRIISTMARCSRCGAEAAEVTKFCPACGAKFVAQPEAIQVDGDPGAYYCWKHKKEVTRVTCGRCEKPICTKCLVIGPAGVRCKDCARNKIPVRMSGVLHDATSGISRGVRNIDGRKVWYLYLFAMIARLFGGWFR